MATRNQSDTDIYILAHRPCKVLSAPGYQPLQVGAANVSTHPYALRDDLGENISALNSRYCELTGQYWVWKNVVNKRNVGFVHYRRLFYQSQIRNAVVSVQQFDEAFRAYDIVLPQPWILRKTIGEQFAEFHNRHDLEIVRDCMHQLSPELIDTFDRTMTSHKLYPYNMFVMKRRDFNEYMQWLFALLHLVDEHIHIQSYTAYNQRVDGFLAERLLTIWVAGRHFNAKEFPVRKNDDWAFGEMLRNNIKKLLYV